MPLSLFDSFKKSIGDMRQQMRDGELRLVASALAFSTLLSLVPFMAVLLSVFKSIGGLEFLYPKIEAFLFSYVEQGVGKQAMAIIGKVLQRMQGGVVGTTGAIALFLSSFKLLHDMERGVNRVWNVKETRPFYRRVIFSSLFFIIIPIGLAIYGGFRSLAFFKPFFRSEYNSLADFVMLSIGLFLVYKLVPYIKVRNRPAIFSALLASLLLIGLKNSFAIIIKKTFIFSKVYGGLAALPIFCVWILGVWYIVLAGVALSASTQKRRWLEENYGADFLSSDPKN